MTTEEIMKRLQPVAGLMDEKTGLLYIHTPTSDFEKFIKLVEANDEDKIQE